MLEEALPVLLIAATVISAVYVVMRPWLIYIVIVTSMPIVSVFYYVKYGPLSALDLFYGIVFISVIASVVLNRKKGFRGAEVAIWYAFVVLAYVLSALLNNIDLLVPLDPLMKVGFSVLAYLSVRNFNKPGDEKRLLLASFISVIFFMIGGVLSLAISGGERYSNTSYTVGLYADEGSLSRAGVVGVLLSLPLGGLSVEYIKYSWIRYATLLGSMMMMGYSVSRNAILSAVAVLVYYSVNRRKIIIAVFVALAGLIIYSQSEVIQENLENKLRREREYFVYGNEQVVEYLGSGRMGRWMSVYEEFEKSDFLTLMTGMGIGYGPHGQHMELVLRAGILGALIVLYQYLRMTKYLLITWRRKLSEVDYYFGGMLIATWVLFLTATPFYEIYLQVILFGLFAAVLNSADDDSVRGSRSEISR